MVKTVTALLISLSAVIWITAAVPGLMPDEVLLPVTVTDDSYMLKTEQWILNLATGKWRRSRIKRSDNNRVSGGTVFFPYHKVKKIRTAASAVVTGTNWKAEVGRSSFVLYQYRKKQLVVKLFNLQGKQLHTFIMHKDEPNRYAFRPAGRLIYMEHWNTAGPSSEGYLIDPADGSKVLKLLRPEYKYFNVYGADLVELNRDTVVFAGNNGEVLLRYNTRTRRRTGMVQLVAAAADAAVVCRLVKRGRYAGKLAVVHGRLESWSNAAKQVRPAGQVSLVDPQRMKLLKRFPAPPRD